MQASLAPVSSRAQHRAPKSRDLPVRAGYHIRRLTSQTQHVFLDVRNAMAAGMVAMLVTASVPVLFGWHSTVVVSGSMTPGVRPGDVVVAGPVTRDTTTRTAPGTVVLVDDPAEPGRLLLHRLVDYDDMGRMILKGDANPGPDSTPVPVQKLKGVATLRIPYVGLPYLWVQQGLYLPALGAVAVLLALIAWQPAQIHERVANGRYGSRRARRRAGGRHRSRS